jgi:hypothetical protein
MVMRKKLFAFTLDLESLFEQGNFPPINQIEHLLSSLDDLGVKITAFTVGYIFNDRPDIIRLFEKYHTQFELHSYTHDLLNPCSDFEVSKGRQAYFNYFKKYPRGYRAPQGRISFSAIERLNRYGFVYDSSIFPSYFPNPWKYFFCNRDIHWYGSSNVIEVPFTSITPFRITLSLSFMKLLGFSFFNIMMERFGLPEIICFDSHLHDVIFDKESFDKLSLFWKFIYSRNKYAGYDYCIKLMRYVMNKGYRFCYLSEIVDTFKSSQSLPIAARTP